MARLPQQVRILKEDLKDSPDWVLNIINPVNSFFENIYQTLNKNVNDDNLASQIKEIAYVTPANYGAHSITSNTVASPTVVTSYAHGLSTGDIIVIAGSNCSPSINGSQTVTVTGVNTFTVPVNVTVAGTYGTWTIAIPNVEFTSTLRTKAIGLDIIQVYDRATYMPPMGPVYAPWVENNGTIVLYPITGLEASKTYLVRIRVT